MIEDADAANAYLHFVHALCEMACNQKRISVQERETEYVQSSLRQAADAQGKPWALFLCLGIVGCLEK